MDIDWTKAPEGATHFYNNVGAFYNFSDKHNCLVFLKGEWEDCNNYSCFSGCLIPKPQPVFTQAMADNGELPQAGMLCLINFPDIDNAWYEYTIDFIGKHMVVATCKEVAERTGHIDNVYFKPIDTRTNKEKAIDDMVEHLTNEGVVTYSNIMLKILVELIKENKIHGVKWVGE